MAKILLSIQLAVKYQVTLSPSPIRVPIREATEVVPKIGKLNSFLNILSCLGFKPYMMKSSMMIEVQATQENVMSTVNTALRVSKNMYNKSSIELATKKKIIACVRVSSVACYSSSDICWNIKG